MTEGLTGFNPLGISVDTETDTFTITDKVFGTIKLILPPNSIPLWFGPFFGSKLAVFKAEQESIKSSYTACEGLIFVISESFDPSLDGVGAALFDSSMDRNLVIDTLLVPLRAKLVEAAEKDKNEKILNRTASLH